MIKLQESREMVITYKELDSAFPDLYKVYKNTYGSAQLTLQGKNEALKIQR